MSPNKEQANPSLEEILAGYSAGRHSSYGLCRALADRQYPPDPPPTGFLTEDDLTVEGQDIPAAGTFAEVEFACRAERIPDYIYNAVYRSVAIKMRWSLSAAAFKGQDSGGPHDLPLLDHNEIEPTELMTNEEEDAEVAESEAYAKAAEGHWRPAPQPGVAP